MPVFPKEEKENEIKIAFFLIVNTRNPDIIYYLNVHFTIIIFLYLIIFQFSFVFS